MSSYSQRFRCSNIWDFYGTTILVIHLTVLCLQKTVKILGIGYSVDPDQTDLGAV